MRGNWQLSYPNPGLQTDPLLKAGGRRRRSGLRGAGFRTIVEEDVLAGLRTTTFHQKFPLTSQPERVVVNPISRSGEDGAISREQYTWRCDRTNRANATACVPSVGTPARYFPFLDTKESWTYDATTAAAGGTPATLGYTQEIAANDNGCSGTVSTVSGYDAYGNLTARQN